MSRPIVYKEDDHPHQRSRKTRLRQWVAKLHQINWRVVGWNCLTIPFIGIIYWVVNAQGIRMQMPVFGLRLHKIPLPFFSNLRNYEGLYRLDLAHVFAIFLLFAVWYLWIKVVRALLYKERHAPRPNMDGTVYHRFIFTLSAIIIVGDAILFYCGLADRVDSLWSATSPFVPILATVVYMAILAFIALIHVRLQGD